MDLKGKVAIVRGTGIGAAITRRFIACGARVCITGRRQEMLDEVTKSLPEGLVKTCAADVSDENEVCDRSMAKGKFKNVKLGKNVYRQLKRRGPPQPAPDKNRKSGQRNQRHAQVALHRP